MELIVSTLNNDLLSAFQSMNNGDNKVYSVKVSEAIKKYAESGTITTTDKGGVPSGAFVGTGTGGITVDASICEKILYAACMVMNDMKAGGNDYLANELANGIHTMVSAGEVKTDVTGTVTPPGISPVPLSGKAVGTMTGVPAPMRVSFTAAFNSMDGMKNGGDEYKAQQMSVAIDAYLKATVVNTNGTVALSGSTGNGKMT
ncbi:MAG: hypothetical protein LBH43_08445 [Treponema sp.]|jgi:hypothetical protein|nr:hypothetical protein [Treponema sp.]